ncbi:RDD family protein [Salinibacter ruber]|uniref:RDD family protein n=1 Tax=Salinibacter ruber (strain DSM 13855 / M31) TaxID=309807 RepID=Q2S3K2_SALRD|nr:RDD family protein [Salinibacter ruber]ABC44422.1 RDD family protein [Salinibacter ruber DSM 13855]
MWYYAVDGEKHGPVTKDEIQGLIDNGELGLDNLVWSRGMEDWKTASEVEDIHPSPPPLPDDEKSPSPPPISKKEHSQVTKQQDSKPETDEPTSPSQEDDIHTDGDATLSAESTDRVGSKTVGITYAGFGSRLVAYGIDILITVVVSVILGAVALSVDSSADPDLLTRGIGSLVTWFYFAGFESSKRQATPGKQLMGLKVTDANMGYDGIGFRKASGRHFGKIISGAPLLLGFIMAAFTERHQALHDKMAGCLVVKNS